MHKICINKNHCNKTLQLLVEVNNHLVKGLIDTWTSMLIMATIVVKELGIMQLMMGSKSYKTTLGVVTQPLKRIDEMFMKVGKDIIWFMIFDINNYNLLLRLDFLIKI